MRRVASSTAGLSSTWASRAHRRSSVRRAGGCSALAGGGVRELASAGRTVETGRRSSVRRAAACRSARAWDPLGGRGAAGEGRETEGPEARTACTPAARASLLAGRSVASASEALRMVAMKAARLLALVTSEAAPPASLRAVMASGIGGLL
jgi:hypothetical protein